MGGDKNREDRVIMRRNPLVAVRALLVLCLVASSVGAQERSGEIVEGKTTKAEILARYGPPAYENDRDLIYYAPRVQSTSSRMAP